MKLKIVIPPIEEQEEIAKVLRASERETQLLREKTIQLRKKKKGIMQQLLTGKKRLSTKK
jgi:type I restriction enzyme S subunit